MGRGYESKRDTTDTFRQKVTRKGVTQPDRWGYDPKPGRAYEEVAFFGPYRTRNVGGKPWMNSSDTEVKVEIQKLEAVPPGVLEWITEKETVLRREEG